MQATNYSERIKEWRRVRGLSQADLAAKLGISPSTVYEWEKSKQPSKIGRRLLDALFADAGTPVKFSK